MSKAVPINPKHWPYWASLGFHALVVIMLLLIGLEWGKKPEMLELVTVDLIMPDAPIAEVSETPADTPPEETPIPEEAESEPEETREIAPQSTAEAPPPFPQAAPEPEPEPTPEPAPAPSLAPQAAPVPVMRPAPPQKEDRDEAETETEKPDFASVLKNLAENKSDSAPENRQSPMLTQPPPVGQALTQSELSALKRQLAGCWNILPGARDADDLVVVVNVTMNPDRTVASAGIRDQARLGDPFFKAAADSALRALRDPRCSPLELPPFKFDQWKEMTIRFDPKDMF